MISPIEDQQSWINAVGVNLGMFQDISVIMQRYSKTCVAHLNADDFGPIQACSGAMPVRPTCVAGAKAPAAGL